MLVLSYCNVEVEMLYGTSLSCKLIPMYIPCRHKLLTEEFECPDGYIPNNKPYVQYTVIYF